MPKGVSLFINRKNSSFSSCITSAVADFSTQEMEDETLV